MLTYTFGTVFKYKNDKFIYLTETLDVVYVAKILDDSLTKALDKMLLKKIQKGSIVSQLGRQFSYIKLTCNDFKNQAALHGHDPISVIYRRYFILLQSESISKIDMLQLKDDILNKPSWNELKDKIIDIVI